MLSGALCKGNEAIEVPYSVRCVFKNLFMFEYSNSKFMNNLNLPVCVLC